MKKFRLQVDFYRERGEDVICICSTYKMPSELEPGYIVKVLKWSEVHQYVEENKCTDHTKWIGSNLQSTALYNVMADIINTKEGRSEVWQPSIQTLMFQPVVDIDHTEVKEESIFESVADLCRSFNSSIGTYNHY